MASPLYSGDQRIKRRVVVIDGHRWTVLRCDAPIMDAVGPLLPRDMGEFNLERRYIAWRYTGTLEDMRTVLHELIHYAEKKTPARISEKSMAVIDKSLLEALDAFGVSLNPLLDGYE